MLWRSFTHDILNWKKSYRAIATAYSLSATIRLFLRSMWRTPLHGRPTQPRSTQSRVWRSGGCHLFSRASLSTTSGKAGSTCWSTARSTWWCCPPQPSSRSWGWSSDAKNFYNRLHSDLFSVVVPSVVCFASTRSLRYAEFLTLTISPYSESISVTQGDTGVFHICRPFFTIVKMHNPPLRSAPNWIYFSDTVCRIVLIFSFIHIFLFYF